MVDILQFYKETTERKHEDQVLEKFHNASGPDARQYNTPLSGPQGPQSPGMYPSNYMGEFHGLVTSFTTCTDLTCIL